VHEATHARLRRYGIGYEEGLRQRVEEANFRRELAFASARAPRRRAPDVAFRVARHVCWQTRNL